MTSEDLIRHAHGSGRQVRRLVLRWVLLGSMVAVLSSADIATGSGQELPAGGGPIPPLRRGANGQFEVVPPAAAAPTRPRASGTRTDQPALRTHPTRRPREDIFSAEAERVISLMAVFLRLSRV
jgi:hypothetical protein